MKKNNLFKIISIVLLTFVILTWIIPTATFDPTTGITVAENPTRVGIWNILNMFVESISYFGFYGIYLLCVGAFYYVVNKTEVYQRMIKSFAKKLKAMPEVFLIITIVVLALLSSVTGIGLMFFLFIPFLITMILKLGYNKMVALASTIGAIFVGMIGSTYGYYITYWLQYVLNVKIVETVYYNVALFAVSTTLLILYVLLYAKKSKKAKEEIEDPLFIETTKKTKKESWPLIVILSLVGILTLISTFKWDIPFQITSDGTFSVDAFQNFHTLITTQQLPDGEMAKSLVNTLKIITDFLGQGLGYYAQSGIKAIGNWDYTDLSIILILSTGLIALIYNIKFNDLLDSYKEGAKKLIKPAFLITLIYAVFLLNYYVPVLTTMISWTGSSFNIITSSLLAMISSVLNVDMMYVAQSTLVPQMNVLTSAPTVTLSVLYQAIYGLVQFIAPTSVLLIAGLAYLNVSYKEWLKFIWKLLIELLVIILVILIIISIII